MPDANLEQMLPHRAPLDPASRAVLVTVRRMAMHGLHDAHAALLMVQHFGLHFRKALVLLRAVVLDLGRIASAPVTIAPCCMARMTAQEGALLAALACAPLDPASANAHLQELTGSAQTDGLLATIRVLANTLSDAGQPIVLD
jgi:hypothetical protein